MPEFKNDKPAGFRPQPAWASVADGKLSLTSYLWRSVNETKLVTKTVTKTVPSHAAPHETVEVKVQVCEPQMTSHWLPTIDRRDSDAVASTLTSLTGQPVDVASLAAGDEGPQLLLVIDKETPLDRLDLRFFAPNVRLLRTALPEPTPLNPQGPAVARLLQGRAKIANDTLTVTRFILEYQTKTVAETVLQDGQEKVVHRQVSKTVSKPVYTQFPVKLAQATTVDGKQLDQAELTRRLANEQPVILLPLDKKPAADEVKLLQGDTILLALPGIDMPPGFAPPVVPASSPPGAPSA